MGPCEASRGGGNAVASKGRDQLFFDSDDTLCFLSIADGQLEGQKTQR